MALITLTIDGELDNPRGFTFEELRRAPDQLADSAALFIRRDVKAMPLEALVAPLGVHPHARFAVVRSGQGQVANIPIEELQQCILVYAIGNLPLSTELGGPVRLFAPRLGEWANLKAVMSISIAEAPAPLKHAHAHQ
jgi:DMSO/TMAO reductase YedYZ molybdopterin-dependent catalytic subunit